MIALDALALAGIDALVPDLPAGARSLACAITANLTRKDAATALLRAARELLGQCDHAD